MRARTLLEVARTGQLNFMKKRFTILILVALMFFALPVAYGSVQAAEDEPAEKSGFGGAFTEFFGSTVGQVYETERFEKASLQVLLPTAIGRIINMVLGFLGLIMLVLFIYAGLLWVTAGGNTDQVDKAKMYIKNAIIGMILALAAFIITAFVVTTVQDALEKKASTNLHRLV